MKKLLTIFAINFLFLNISFAQNKVSNEIKQINNYVESINLIRKRHTAPDLIFADVSQTEKSKWRKFSSERVLEKFRENTETYSISYNWKKNDKIIQSNFTLFSESGDWANYIYYYFRENGTLAKIETEFRTFYGHFIAKQSIYFSPNSKILKKNINYYDLEKETLISIPEKWLPDNLDNMNNFSFYKTIAKLPYSHLLKTKK